MNKKQFQQTSCRALFLTRSNYVECEDCGCLVNREKAKEVTTVFSDSSIHYPDGLIEMYKPRNIDIYCKHCAPKYDIVNKEGETRYLIKKSVEIIEVDKNGKIKKGGKN